MSRRELTNIEKSWQKNLKAIWDSKKNELELTQEKLAAALGWKTQAAVTSYLNGRIPLNTDAKLKFAKALKVSVSEIDPEFSTPQERLPQNSTEFLEQYGDRIASMPESEQIKLAGKIEMLVAQFQALQDERNKNS